MCVGLDGPKLFMLDATTLATLATLPAPAAHPGRRQRLQRLRGRRLLLPRRATTGRSSRPPTRHLARRRQDGDGFTLERDYDLTARLGAGDKIFSALPDWSAGSGSSSRAGVVGTVDRDSGTVAALPLGEPITNSFAVDEGGASTSSPTRRSTGSTPAPTGPRRDLARGLRELRHLQARAGRAGLGHDADADGPRAGGDHRQRRPDERRRLPRAADGGQRVLAVRCSRRARARPTTR